MLLDLTQMKEITRGVARLEEENGIFHLLRFTEAQAKVYADAGKTDFYNKTFATAGVRLAFRTNSKKLSFDYTRSTGSSRTFIGFDVYENGAMVKHFEQKGNELRSGHISIALSEGEKDVEVYLPWSSRIDLSNVKLEDGATLQGLYRKHTMINFGDSITHGYDATYPSLSYACQIARLMDADAVNKGIGGDIFFPPMLADADPISPDYITVAYGTNDWGRCTYDVLKENAHAFYKRLTELYPNAIIYGITPICRLDANKKTPFDAPAYTVDAVIREACAGLPNVTVLNGWKFTPALKEFYSDFSLHPNDLGFGVYAESLYRAILAAEQKI